MPPKSNPETAKRLEEKTKVITAVLNATDKIDLWKLRGLAITDGGLVNDEIRRKAWPKLVGIHERYWNDKRTHTSDASTVNTDATPKKSNVKNPRSADENRRTLESKRTPSFDESDSSITSANSFRDKVIASSLDFRQIELDVARCTWHLLTGTQRLQRLQMEYKRNRKVARLIRRKQRRLANLINLTLVKSYKHLRMLGKDSSSPTFERDNTLRYYQGYHDVACIILSTLSGNAPLSTRSITSSLSLEKIARATGLDLPACVLLRLSQSHFRDCMRVNFLQLQTTMRLTLLPLIAYFDPTLHDFLADCNMEPFFALSWIITWFSHDVRDTDLAKRLFDFFISSHPLMPFYVSVAMVCHPMNRQDVLQTECDFASVHQTLAALPRNSSMVGWKYQPGDGYVSDDEQSVNDDESLASQNSVDTEFILHEEVIHTVNGHEKIGAEAVSIVSSSLSTCYDARVPFQEIFDLALVYMERLPPRNLPRLARRYFGREFVENLTKQAPGIFQPPPSWTVSPTAKTDRELRQEAKCVEKLASSDINELEFHMQQSSQSNSPPLLPRSYHDPIKQIAVLAAGISDRDDEQRRKKRNRLMFFGSAVAVILIAVFWGRLRKKPLTVEAPHDDPVVSVDHADPELLSRGKGQTILAASVCWETLDQTIEKEHLLSLSIEKPVMEIVAVEPALTTNPITREISRGLQRFDRVVDMVIDLVLKEALALGARISKLGATMNTMPIAKLSDKTKAFASHLRAIFQRLRTNKTLAGYLLPVLSRFSPSAANHQPRLPGAQSEAQIAMSSYQSPMGIDHSGTSLIAPRGLSGGIGDNSVAYLPGESPLAVLSRIVTNECAGNPLCQNLLGLSNQFHRMQMAAINAKNAPRKTLQTAIQRVKPAITTAIGGVSLAKHYHPPMHSEVREIEEEHVEEGDEEMN